MTVDAAINFLRFRSQVLDPWFGQAASGRAGTSSAAIALLQVAARSVALGAFAGYFDQEKADDWWEKVGRAGFLPEALQPWDLLGDVPWPGMDEYRLFSPDEDPSRSDRTIGEMVAESSIDLRASILCVEQLASEEKLTAMLSIMSEPNSYSWPESSSILDTQRTEERSLLAEASRGLGLAITRDAWAIDGFYQWQQYLESLGDSLVGNFIDFEELIEKFITDVSGAQADAGNDIPVEWVTATFRGRLDEAFPGIEDDQLDALLQLRGLLADWWLLRDAAGAPLPRRDVNLEERRTRVEGMLWARFVTPKGRAHASVENALAPVDRPFAFLVYDLDRLYHSFDAARRSYVERRAHAFAYHWSNQASYESAVSDGQSRR